MTTLHVTQVTIKDVLGARSLAIEPGKVTIVEGRNASGKSTALSAIQAGLGGGVSLARLARVTKDGEPAAEPEVVILLEGPGEAYRVRRDADGIEVQRRIGAAYEDVQRPQQWLRGLYDAEGNNPVRLLQTPEKDLALLLLQALPLTLDRVRLDAILAPVPGEIRPAVPRGLHPLEETGLIRGAIYDARTGVNRDARGKADAAEQILRELPAVAPEDVAPALTAAQEKRQVLAAELATERERAVAAHDAEEQRIKAGHKEAVRKLRADQDARDAAARAEVERKLAAERAEVERLVVDLIESDEAALDAVDAQRDAALAALSGRGVDVEALARQVGELQARSKTAAQDAALRDLAQQHVAEASRLQAQSDTLTAALDALDALRRSLADSLPIKGLEIAGREIRVDGVPWSQVNLARRLDVLVGVTVLRARQFRLPALFLDGAEALDAEHFEALTQRLLAEPDVLAFVARVDDSAERLEVRTLEAPAPAPALESRRKRSSGLGEFGILRDSRLAESER